jgi:hypothetical protein
MDEEKRGWKAEKNKGRTDKGDKGKEGNQGQKIQMK